MPLTNFPDGINAAVTGNITGDVTGDVTGGTSIPNAKFLNLALNTTPLVIASGVITVTGSYHLVDTEGGAGTDNLDTINGGSDGDILVLRTTLETRDVVVTEVGNIMVNDGTSFTLSSVDDAITLLKVGSNWISLSNANNG